MISKNTERYEDRPQFQNRIGPGGYKLDPTEAVAWFPPLNESSPMFRQRPTAGCAVLVGYQGLTFWLYNVEIGVEPGVYFGDIKRLLPENDADLNIGQNIGFEQRHILDMDLARTPNSKISGHVDDPSSGGISNS